MRTKQPYDAYYMRTSHFLQNIVTQVDKVPDGAKPFKDEGVSGRKAPGERPERRSVHGQRAALLLPREHGERHRVRAAPHGAVVLSFAQFSRSTVSHEEGP